MLSTLEVFTDGGARGNPGPAAVGMLIYKVNGAKSLLYENGEYIGETTNNVAEYTAVIKALRWISKNAVATSDISLINFYLDSQLVVSQLMGKFKVKQLHLQNLFFSIKQMEEKIKVKINYVYIPREKNFKADSLVNKALDLQK